MLYIPPSHSPTADNTQIYFAIAVLFLAIFLFRILT